MTSYKDIDLSISASKARKLASLKPTNLTAAELRGSDDKILLHPANYAIVMKAKNRGCRIQLAEGEIIFDMDQRQGGSVWSFLKDKLWPAIKPAVSQALDAAVAPVMGAVGPYAPVVPAGRQILKSLTGLGVSSKKLGKGTPEMKAHMAKLRSMRKSGLKAGSFRLN
jgi:hypothetical protein